MSYYPDTLSLLEARTLFFRRANLGHDGGYTDRWVRVESKPIPFYFPNTPARVAAARLHDLHHIAAEYQTDWPGEAQIAAWEIASGCAHHYWAWVLNLGAFTIGMALCPKRLFQAFVRGRHASNLYKDGFAESCLGNVSVGELRHRLGLAGACRAACPADVAWFAIWCIVGFLWHGMLAVLGVVAVWVAWRLWLLVR
jgi:hypothetical protein